MDNSWLSPAERANAAKDAQAKDERNAAGRGAMRINIDFAGRRVGGVDEFSWFLSSDFFHIFLFFFFFLPTNNILSDYCLVSY